MEWSQMSPEELEKERQRYRGLILKRREVALAGVEEMLKHPLSLEQKRAQCKAMDDQVRRGYMERWLEMSPEELLKERKKYRELIRERREVALTKTAKNVEVSFGVTQAKGDSGVRQEYVDKPLEVFSKELLKERHWYRGLIQKRNKGALAEVKEMQKHPLSLEQKRAQCKAMDDQVRRGYMEGC